MIIGRTRIQFRSLAFCEKFTILHKVIANTLNIVRPFRNIGTTSLLLAITLLNSASTLPRRDGKVDVVVIDAGHGGKDHGTHGAKLKEKDLALKIALKLGAYIEKNLPDVKVVYTRKDDRYLALDERAEYSE